MSQSEIDDKQLFLLIKEVLGAETAKLVSQMSAKKKEELRDKIGRLMKCLTPREEKAMRMRFGLKAEENQRLDEAGGDQRARERIREIEAKALSKLRHQRQAKR